MASTGYRQSPIEMSSSMKHRRLDDNASSGDEGEYGCCGYVLVGMSLLLLVFTFPFSLFVSLKVVQEYQRAVIFRLGRLKSKQAQGPGLFFVLPCVDNFVTVDLRTFNFNIRPQEILTKDAVTVMVDAVIYAHIYDPTMSTVKIKDARASSLLLGATTLRTVVGTVGLSELLSDRDRIDKTMKESLDSVTHVWGIKVERVEIKDVRIPVQMQRAMAAEAESAREAKAKVIAADGEMRASRNLKEAADVLTSAPNALQLRYLQTIQTVAEENNHTVMFPVPSQWFNGTLAEGLKQPLMGALHNADNTQF